MRILRSSRSSLPSVEVSRGRTVQGNMIMDLLKGLNEEDGVTIVQVTHSDKYAAYGNCILQLLDGRIEMYEQRHASAARTAQTGISDQEE